MLALPQRHPLLAFAQVPLAEVVNYPLVLCNPELCEGCGREFERLLRSIAAQPQVAEYVGTHDLMLALVAAGYGVGLSSAAQTANCLKAAVVVRPLVEPEAVLTTYLLRAEGTPSGLLTQFIDRAERIGRAHPTIRRPAP